MRCQVCSAEVAKGATFCQHCGAKLPAAGAMAGDAAPNAGLEAPSALDDRESPDDFDPRARISRRRGGPDTPESTLWEGGYSPKAMIGMVALGVVITIALIVAGVWLDHWPTPLGLILLVWLFVAGRYAAKRIGIHYRLTNHMFYHERGVLTRRTDRIEAIDINDVTYEQGLLGRMVGVGRVKISSSDKTDPVFWVDGIENVQEVARLIDQARRAERLRRGVSVEAI